MKLNYDCVRDVLLTCEDLGFDEKPSAKFFIEHEKLQCYTVEDILYSFKQLDSAGYIEIREFKALRVPFDFIFKEITWSGHEFLKNIKDDSVWSKAKEKVSSSVGTASISILSATATAVIKNKLGL
ncbi:DUF2513 domain-containing protein [Halalkalibacterium halodurans]|uniref:DUF2513 domain-containing protein n=1 Tax=Halalkalibacterium halodurans TaxID=86665 RepID=UPI0010FD2E61|nr:DUF2513 domain-containing protein [Halalkalibacterium halodurans]